jgi:hypothetical protein
MILIKYRLFIFAIFGKLKISMSTLSQLVYNQNNTRLKKKYIKINDKY